MEIDETGNHNPGAPYKKEEGATRTSILNDKNRRGYRGGSGGSLEHSPGPNYFNLMGISMKNQVKSC